VSSQGDDVAYITRPGNAYLAWATGKAMPAQADFVGKRFDSVDEALEAVARRADNSTLLNARLASPVHCKNGEHILLLPDRCCDPDNQRSVDSPRRFGLNKHRTMQRFSVRARLKRETRAQRHKMRKKRP
jgi:hypothetical protein